MKTTIFTSAAAFLDAVRPTLGEREAEHHLVLGIAEALVASPPPNGVLFAASITDDDGLVLAAMMTGRRPLLIASDRASIASGAPLLCDALSGAGRTPTHAIGLVGQVDAVAEEWARRTGTTARVGMHQRIYKLTELRDTPAVSGRLRVATGEDVDLLTDWIGAFEQEALAAPLAQPARATAERRIAAGEVYFWCDPEPRTMAGAARPTKRAIAVNAVYTPPEWRRHGYATACVAELSRLLLRRGFEMCVLYTDLANPTSNAVYTRIGYQPIRDFLMYDLAGTR
jgi:uncharacterized protein